MTLMVTPEAIEAAVTLRTKAIIPVHYAGAGDIDAIQPLANVTASQLSKMLPMPSVRITGDILAKGTAIFSSSKYYLCGRWSIVTDNENLVRQLRMLEFHCLGVDVMMTYQPCTAG